MGGLACAVAVPSVRENLPWGNAQLLKTQVLVSAVSVSVHEAGPVRRPRQTEFGHA